MNRLHLFREHRILVAVLFAGLVAGGFFLGRAAFSTAAAGPRVIDETAGPSTGQPLTPPGPDETPAPGATPDRTKPFGFVPYETADRMAPKFRGAINGLQFGVKTGHVPECATPILRPDWEEAIAGTPFDLPHDALPPGVTVWGMPRVATCGDGRVLWMTLDLTVRPGPPGVGAAGGSVTVSRMAELRWWPQEAPEDRWTAGAIAGRPAVFLGPVIDSIGEIAVFVVDEETAGSTRLSSSGVSLEYLQQLAEDLYR